MDAFLVFEGALVVMIGQAPAWFDAKERAAVGPQSQIRNAGQIDCNDTAGGRIGKHESAVGHVDEFEDVGTGELFSFERHWAAGELDVFRFTRKIIPGRKMTAVKSGRHFELE